MKMKEKILSRHAQYDAQVHALLQELAPLGDDLLNRKPDDGGWSAIQTLHHLILVEENSMAYLRKKLSYGPVLEKPGLSAWARSLLLRLTLQSPIKFKAPKAAGNERLPEHATFRETEAQWQKIRTEWFEFFEKMPAELIDKAVYKHPRAGRQSWVQMLDFFISHFDRHRAQARRAVS
jgi:uncharacterized damage-inducible protein DinB